MPVERTLYFANFDAYNIKDTIDFVNDLHRRGIENGLWQVRDIDQQMSHISDVKYLPTVSEFDPTIDIFTGLHICRGTWWLRYGVRDNTFAYFNGDSNSIATFPVDEVEMIDLTNDDSTIDTLDEVVLVGTTQEMRENDIGDLTYGTAMGAVRIGDMDLDREHEFEYDFLAGDRPDFSE